MGVELEIDLQVLKSEIKKTYAAVSQEPERDFIFPTGRPWTADLGYPAELASVPETDVGSFAGVANPWQLGRLAPGERVLDLGSGAGTNSLIAAQACSLPPLGSRSPASRSRTRSAPRGAATSISGPAE